MTNARSAASSLAARLWDTVLHPLNRTFVGKGEIVELLGICLVSGENLLLIGPPGTAKSSLVRELGRRIVGRTFEYLLTPYTEPNELFGPFDLRRLREGELVTNTEGMLPEADLVFLDELFHANSAVLNSLLGVLNERVLRRGREVMPLPLLTVVAATNGPPTSPDLAALYDRFLLRVMCEAVPEEMTQELLRVGWALESRAEPPHDALTVDEIRILISAVGEIDLAPVIGPIAEVVGRLRRAGIAVSDRSAVKIQRAIAASSVLNGRAVANTSDLWVFRHVWATRDQSEIVAGVVDEILAEAPEVKDQRHSQARPRAAPDPEALDRELSRIDRRIENAEPGERNWLLDRLGVLSARCEWVKDELKRKHLNGRVATIWQKCESA